MESSVTLLSVILFAVISLPSPAAAAATDPVYYNHTDIAEFINTSCKVTLYPQLCVSSLSSYAGPLKARQSDLVKAAVIISLLNSRNASVWASGLKARGNVMSERENAALNDCIQDFKASMYEISGSVAELKHLKPDTFEYQMSNVQTWMSAALTEQDSCLDGFHDLNASGNVTAMVTGRVQNVSKLISNALALLKAFAANGGGYELHV